MDRNQQTHYSENGGAYPPQNRPFGTLQTMDGNGLAAHSQPAPVHANSPHYTSRLPVHTLSPKYLHDVELANTSGLTQQTDPFVKQYERLYQEWKQRLYWIVPLVILAVVLCILFEVYKSSFERWVSPLADWLRQRKAWSWVLPVVILFILSFPPLFGHEIVQIVVGLTYPLGIALAIACAGSILGEAGCFVVFKYSFTWWVEKQIASKLTWAATARVTQQAGFRGVLVIRYSIIPPHLANPLFACTGMKFWLYMTTVILSLPKALVFVALGTPSSEASKGVKYAKVIAICVVIAITLFASRWIRIKMKAAMEEILAERAATYTNGELGMEDHREHEQMIGY